MLAILIALIIFLVYLIIATAIQGLIYWGIGAFVCWAFSIPFTFTFWHGLAIGFIVSILAGIFKGGNHND